MGTIAEKLQKLSDSKAAIKAALESKGQKPTDQLSTYAAMIDGLTDDRDATATAADLLKGKTAYVGGKKLTGTIPSKAAATITPGKTDQTIAAGQYLAGAQTIKGDANLRPENIRKGVTLMGVTGVMEPGSYETVVEDINYDYWSKSDTIPDGTPITYESDTEITDLGVLAYSAPSFKNNAYRASVLKQLSETKFLVSYYYSTAMYIAIFSVQKSMEESPPIASITDGWKEEFSLCLCTCYSLPDYTCPGSIANSILAETVGNRIVVLLNSSGNAYSSSYKYMRCFVLQADLNKNILTMENNFVLDSNSDSSYYPEVITEYGLCIYRHYNGYRYGFFIKSDGTITRTYMLPLIKMGDYSTIVESIYWKDNYILYLGYQSAGNYESAANFGAVYMSLNKIPESDIERASVTFNATSSDFVTLEGCRSISNGTGTTYYANVILKNSNTLYLVYTNQNSNDTTVRLVELKFSNDGFLKSGPFDIRSFSNPVNIKKKVNLHDPFLNIGVIRKVDAINSKLVCDNIRCMINEQEGKMNYDIVPYEKITPTTNVTGVDSNYFYTKTLVSDYIILKSPIWENVYMVRSGDFQYAVRIGNVKRVTSPSDEVVIGVTKVEISPHNPGKITAINI